MRQYKVCLLGDFAVGKTSLVRRYVEGRFEEKYLTSLGVHISRRAIDTTGGRANLLIWDLDGSEAFSAVHDSYLQGSAGGLIVCDLTRRETLEHLNSYAKNFTKINPGSPVIILANKSDLDTAREISSEDLAGESARLSAQTIVTSAKTGEGVEEAMRLITAQMEARNGRGL